MNSNVRTAAEEWRCHWLLVSATTAGMSLAAVLTSTFGLMVEPLEKDLGWTRSQLSSGPAIVSMSGLLLASAAGHAIDKLGARLCGLFVVLITCAAITGMAAIGELWQWWAAWALFGIAAAFTSTVWLAPVATVFRAGRGMALAITLCGSGISMALVPPVAEYFIQAHGWRTAFVALAAIWGLLTLPLVLAFVPSTRPAPAAATVEPAAATQLTGLTPREGFRSRAFYFLFLASLVNALTGIALILNLVPILTSTGLERTQAVAVAGSMGLASIVGRIVGGWLMDRYEARTLAMCASITALLFPLTLLLTPGVVWTAMLGVIAFGMTSGVKMNAIVYLTSTHLGARSFGLFYGTISITMTVGIGIGPLIANYVFDITNSYAPVLWAAVPGFMGAALLFFALGPAPDFTRAALVSDRPDARSAD